jgi:CheY-like chemotaxis protein
MMYRDGMGRVLIALSDGALRDAATAALEQAGYHVARVADAAEAIGRTRASPYPLVVLFGADWLEILNAVLPDRRLGRHHAYIMILPRSSGPTPGISLFPQLWLSALCQPLDGRVLRDMVAWAMHSLAADATRARPGRAAQPGC